MQLQGARSAEPGSPRGTLAEPPTWGWRCGVYTEINEDSSTTATGAPERHACRTGRERSRCARQIMLDSVLVRQVGDKEIIIHPPIQRYNFGYTDGGTLQYRLETNKWVSKPEKVGLIKRITNKILGREAALNEKQLIHTDNTALIDLYKTPSS